VLDGVKVADGVRVAVLDGVNVLDGVRVAVFEGVNVLDGVRVAVLDGVNVLDGVRVAVLDGVRVAVFEGVKVLDGVRVGVTSVSCEGGVPVPHMSIDVINALPLLGDIVPVYGHAITPILVVTILPVHVTGLDGDPVTAYPPAVPAIYWALPVKIPTPYALLDGV